VIKEELEDLSDDDMSDHEHTKMEEVILKQESINKSESTDSYSSCDQGIITFYNCFILSCAFFFFFFFFFLKL
jgi:hypothetical protein